MPAFVEVAVNVPIRRSFRKQSPPPDLPGFAQEQTPAEGEQFQTFHYHLPPELMERVEPGHLVWVPFGRQTVQGIVLGLRGDAPVPKTRAIERLARPHPILTPEQISLAQWMAERYCAPLVEALKLFVPPGLLHKEEAAPGVRVKREEAIRLAVAWEEVPARLERLARPSKQAAVLQALRTAGQEGVSRSWLMEVCGLKSDSVFRTLAKRGEIRWEGEQILPTRQGADLDDLIAEAQGLAQYQPLLRALAQADRPLWKSELYAQAGGNLAQLRALQSAGIIHMEERVRLRDPLAGQHFPVTEAPRFTDQQEAAWAALQSAIFPGEGIRHRACLLHGVTGSGKTEIYLRAIHETLDRGRQAIVLVPEIALTPQTVARFAGRFPDRVSVIHSGLGVGERYDVWRQIRDGAVDIVVGPRSALFSPLPRLGLVILDEEHEASYKQNAEEWGSFTLFYDARSVAEEMARLTRSGLIFGSATPSLERYHAAQSGALTLIEMPSRVTGHGLPAAAADSAAPAAYAELPPVEVVDMRQELRADHRSIFSRSLLSELHATLAAGEQAILFLNRRGSSTFVLCRDCGHVVECDRCDVPLTYHERADVLICHHCNKRFPIPQVCPNPECGSKRIKYFGSGTQRIVDEVTQLLPQARTLRWDADTTTGKGSHQAILSRFARQEANVLVGTQMIAKGLDLPLVTLVGVIAADVGLYLPDFRSPERTFQLLMQVAGRAGRSQRGGRVIFQSYTPDHYAIQAAAQHDYRAFYQREIGFRQEHSYPPFSRLARLIYWDKKLEKAQAASKEMVQLLRQRAKDLGGDGIQILGPAPAFFPRYRGFYRWQIILKAADPAELLRGVPIPFGWRVDVDPASML